MCEHFNRIATHQNFLHPYMGKVIWTCLNDGCLKIKKHAVYEELIAATDKLSSSHKVLINTDTFEIYCTFCRKEIYDNQSTSDHKQSSTKLSPLMFRQTLTDIDHNNSEEILFGSISQYPASFQKHNKGLCGLKKSSLNGYLNAVIQLLSSLPSLQNLAISTDLNKILNKPLKIFLEILQQIWSGNYRILMTSELQQQIILNNDKLLSYRNKNPQFILYEILRWLYEEFSYAEVECQNKITSQAYDEWKPSDQWSHYSPLRQFFTGKCLIESLCKCGKKIKNGTKFESLRMSFEQSSSFEVQADLVRLIQETLNWRSQKLAKNCSCGNKLTQFYSFVQMPNNLLLELGDNLDGLFVSLPSQIDLSKFSEQNAKRCKNEKKNNDRVIYQYRGCITRINKSYVSHVKIGNEKQYLCDNQIVREAKKPSKNIKIALYMRKSERYASLARNLTSSLQVGVQLVIPLPDYWISYLHFHQKIQPLINPFICNHGKIKPNINQSKMKNGPQRIPIQIYDFILETFGGRAHFIQSSNDICSECTKRLNFIEQLKSSEKQLAIFADKLSHKKQKILIDQEWINQWKKFAYQQNYRNYRLFGNPRPGPITYFDQLKQQSTRSISQNKNKTHQDIKRQPKDKIQIGFKKISPEVWYFFNKFYGGEPPTKDPVVNLMVKTSVNLRYQTLQSAEGYFQLVHKTE